MSYVLAIHGGAGTIKAGGDEAPYQAGLHASLAAGESILKSGGSAQAAVVAAAMALDVCPLFNAGQGAVFTLAAEHELDAALMDGGTLRAGSVAIVRRVKNPIFAAQALEEGRCVLLGGEAADNFAVQAGLPTVDNNYFSRNCAVPNSLPYRRPTPRESHWATRLPHALAPSVLSRWTYRAIWRPLPRPVA
jgi:beta-aspartyl-peptidase (threonine type)